MAASVAMDGQDRALMLGVPGAAVLAAFALPTFKRSTTAAIDWFSMFFFSLSAIAIWVIYMAMHTGVPAKPAANVAKLAPGFVATFSPLAGMPLKRLILNDNTQVATLRYVSGMPIEDLACDNCAKVDDLKPLRGLPLKSLSIENTAVADLSPLKDSTIESLNVGVATSLVLFEAMRQRDRLHVDGRAGSPSRPSSIRGRRAS